MDGWIPLISPGDFFGWIPLISPGDLPVLADLIPFVRNRS